jgi:phytoene synthase
MPRASDFPAVWTTDIAACRALIRDGSKTFHAASFLLPRRVREPAYALYAFCRLADDAIDRERRPDAALEAWRERLARCYQARPLDHPADRAFADIVARFDLPRALPEALLDGFAWDASGRRYETFAELQDYAARVAGAVGAMMTVLMGRRERAVVARACDLGVAMQLTNIARDVGEDARAGRLYLPRDWMREAGLDPDSWLAAPIFDARLASVVARLLRAADDFYRRAETGVGALPVSCRPGIHAARLIYAEIGREIGRRRFDSVSQRAVVPAWTKIALLGRACARALTGVGPLSPAAPATATRFLVEAAAQPAQAAAPPWWNMPARFVRVIDLFERLERRDQVARESPSRRAAA